MDWTDVSACDNFDNYLDLLSKRLTLERALSQALSFYTTFNEELTSRERNYNV